MGKYDDIIDLPRKVSDSRPRMSDRDRAAQFSPFAALTGYGDAVEETARLTGDRLELDECEMERINRKLLELKERIGECPKISVTYFLPDEKKKGGKYITCSENLKRIDEYERCLLFTDGRKIYIDTVIDIEITE